MDHEYSGDEREQAQHLDDEQMSLKSKLAGGGRDVGAQASREETRLCPACGRVTTFVQGVCSNCDYRPGTATVADAPPFNYGMPREGSSVMRWVLIVIIILVLAGAGVFAYLKWPRHAATDAGTTAGADATADSSASTAAGQTTGDAAGTIESHAGTLDAVAIDDALRSEVTAALKAGNDAWKAQGAKCYVYRYNLFENTVPATSQSVRINAYVGGPDAGKCTTAPANAPLLGACQALLDKLQGHAGVKASLQLVTAGGEEVPAADDVYIRYGYYYGKEHWSEIKPVVDALEASRQSEGQYPTMLDTNLINPPITTYGGFKYKANGFGYLPLFKTDGSGNIIMGSGSGLAKYLPEACTGYYLVLFTEANTEGLDMYSNGDMLQYEKTIARFPYQPDGPVKNMPLNPDGKPDGIACIVKNGELVE